MWWAPWKTTRPWMPAAFRGSDEWGNRSIAVTVPALGTFILFVGRFDRSNPVVVHEEDGTYWAEVVDMPGLFAAADTRAELDVRLAEAMALYESD